MNVKYKSNCKFQGRRIGLGLDIPNMTLSKLLHLLEPYILQEFQP